MVIVSATGRSPIRCAPTWQLDPEDVRLKLTSHSKAVMAVHLYGLPCDMDPLVSICRENHLSLIEDCAEAIDSFYKGRHVGTLGDIATFKETSDENTSRLAS